MTSKEQRKLKKRKAKEDQKKKNLLRKRTIARQIQKQERLKAKEERDAEKAENRANAAALREIKEQRALEEQPVSPKAQNILEKLEVAQASYDKVKDKLTEEQRQQVLKNIAILQELADEHIEAAAHRDAVNKELEDKGASTFEEKMNLLAEEAKAEFGEGCIDQIVCSDEPAEAPIGGSADCTFQANP